MANCEPHIQVHHMAPAMCYSLGIPCGIPLAMPCVIGHPTPRKTCNSSCLKIRRGNYISRDDFNSEVCFITRDLEKFRFFDRNYRFTLFRKFGFSGVSHSPPLLKRISSQNSTHMHHSHAYATIHNFKTVSGMITRLRSQSLTTQWAINSSMSRGRPLHPHPRLTIYTYQMATNFI